MENNENQNINKVQTQTINNSSNSQNQNQYPPNQLQQKNIPFTKPNERVKTKVNNKI
jgi:hypothetical protein